MKQYRQPQQKRKVFSQQFLDLRKTYLIRYLLTFICCLVGYGVLVICVLMMVATYIGHSGVSEALLVRAMTYGFGGLLFSLFAFKRYSCVNISRLWVVCTWLFMLPIMGFLWGVIIAAIIFHIYAKLENKEKQNPELQYLRNTIKNRK